MSGEIQATQPEIDSFFSSSRSEAFKARVLLWSFAFIGLTISLLRTEGSTSALVVAGVFILIIGLVDRYFLREFRPGQLVIKLTEHGIESPLLSGSLKKLEWKYIAGVSIVSRHDQPYLAFEVAPELGLLNRRNFITGSNSAKPTISLAGLDASAQDKLAESVARNIESRTSLSGVDLKNPVREARDFMTTVRALAPTPWVTAFLVVANTVVWIAMLAAGAKFLGSSVPVLFEWGANSASAVENGETWRIFTSMFLHGSVFHLLINMAALLSAGLIVERIYGHHLFALIYLASGIVGSALSLSFASQYSVAVGASGAVFGVTGALFVAIFQHRHRLPKSFSKHMITSLSFFITYSLVQGFTKGGIDGAGHIGGLLAGVSLACLLPERLADEQQSGRTVRGGVALALTAVVTLLLVQFAPPAKIDMARAIQGSESATVGMKLFTEVMHELDQEEKDLAAGKISPQASDERSRTYFAPRMAEITKQLYDIYLPPDDPRLSVLKAVSRMSELMHESFAMESVSKPGERFPQPKDPERATFLKNEMQTVMAGLKGQ